MTLIIVIIVLLLLFGGGGGYYAHRSYGAVSYTHLPLQR